MQPLYTARVTVTSGRDGGATSDDGRLDVRLGFPKALGGAGDATNPEQLFAAGFAACFASSLKAAAAQRKVALRDVRVDADATLAKRDDGSFLVSHVRLAVHGDGFGADAAAIVAEAKRICAYSNATRGNVETEVVLA